MPAPVVAGYIPNGDRVSLAADAAGTEDSRLASARMLGAGRFREPPRRVGVVLGDDEKKRRRLEPNDQERVLTPDSSTLTSSIIHQQPYVT